MSLLRSHLLPHFAALGLLIGVAATGIVRVHGELDYLRRAAQTRLALGDDDQRLADLDEALAAVRLAWQQVRLAPAPMPDELIAVHQAMLRLVRLAERPLPAASLLRGDVEYQKLQLLARNSQSALPATVAAIGPEPPLADLSALLSELSRRTNRQAARLAAETVDRHARLVLTASLLFVVTIVVATVYLYAVNHFLAKPVADLAAVARRVTGGDLSARAERRGEGPVTALAADFNRMVDILVESLAKEERVVRELQERTRQLQAANEHKSRFLATISHELKTPLNAIIGFADILASGLHGPLTERQADYLGRVGAAGRHLLGMISDLIDLAKIDIGALRLEPAPLAVGEVIRETADLLAPQRQKKQQELTLTLPADLPMAVLDRQRLHQVLINLLGNAIKFTPTGGRLAIAARVAGNDIAITVRDNGIGIPADAREAIFEEFVQLAPHLERQHEGTGIGLALTRRLVHLQQGRIELESAPGEGSTFTVYLPLQPPPSA